MAWASPTNTGPAIAAHTPIPGPPGSLWDCPRARPSPCELPEHPLSGPGTCQGCRQVLASNLSGPWPPQTWGPLPSITPGRRPGHLCLTQGDPDRPGVARPCPPLWKSVRGVGPSHAGRRMEGGDLESLGVHGAGTQGVASNSCPSPGAGVAAQNPAAAPTCVSYGWGVRAPSGPHPGVPHCLPHETWGSSL